MENIKGAVFTAELPKGDGTFYKIELKDIDEATYIMASNLVKSDKEIEATKMVLKALHVGGDDIEQVLSNFKAVHAAMSVVLELLTPLEATLKKK